MAKSKSRHCLYVIITAILICGITISIFITHNRYNKRNNITVTNETSNIVTEVRLYNYYEVELYYIKELNLGDSFIYDVKEEGVVKLTFVDVGGFEHEYIIIDYAYLGMKNINVLIKQNETEFEIIINE